LAPVSHPDLDTLSLRFNPKRFASMNVQDQTAIEGLFDRLKQAEAQSGPRDAEAERLIGNLVQQQPAASYLMAQAVIVQEQALQQLQSRVENLEQELASRPQAGGGFLGGLFGGGAGAAATASKPPAPPRAAPTAAQRSGGWGAPAGARSPMAAMQQGGQGGGFLAGAMQTAMGVAGGVLIGNAIAGLFSDPAEAVPAEAAAAPAEEDTQFAEEPPMEEEGGFFDEGFGDEEF
jgi:hypothetical protein